MVWKLIDPSDASIFVLASIIVLTVVGNGQKKTIAVLAVVGEKRKSLRDERIFREWESEKMRERDRVRK